MPAPPTDVIHLPVAPHLPLLVMTTSPAPPTHAFRQPDAPQVPSLATITAYVLPMRA